MKINAVGFALVFLGLTATCASQGRLQQQPLGTPTGDILLPPLTEKARPNIIFILVDDQDIQLDSLSYMPLLDKHLAKKGTFYKNHFAPTAICCPARVSIWTGRYAHNTNVTDVSPPYGGFPKFIQQGFNSNFLPVWLQDAGYNTYYTGKLFNAHTVENYNSPFIAGFNGSDFLLDPYTYSYLYPAYQRNHDPPVLHNNTHTVDLITEKAYGYLEEAIAADGPFFLGVAPVAPHSNIRHLGEGVPGLGEILMTAPIPAKRHEHLFEDVKIPRTPNFNPEEPSGVNWIARLPKLNQTVIDYNDHFYRSRLRALQAVDELVDGLVSRLEKQGILDNTYIIYTSDNGYHVGQHRLPPGKECGFEEDIRVPLFIRGPEVPAGRIEDSVTTHIDLAPTVFNIAGIPPREDFDGSSVRLASSDSRASSHEHANVEFWGVAVPEGEYASFGPDNPAVIRNNTYKALRINGNGYDIYYSVWCNNEHQLYDLKSDPYELNNLYPKHKTDSDNGDDILISGHRQSELISRLDSLLMVLKSCKGVDCVHPWKVLHPSGDVNSLSDAMGRQFNHFYREQVKVAYDRCEFGYLLDAEGPQDPIILRDGLNWHHWV